MTALSQWQDFYVIVGSSAGALIGLQFVVMTLLANRPVAQGLAQAGEAFATPTIVHFATALLIAAAMSAPWHGVAPVLLLWGLMGIAGVSYSVNVTLRMRRQTLYQPEFEDWLFHSILPCVAYTALIASASAGFLFERRAQFGVAAATLLLLFIGIHNAWDAVTYHVFVQRRESKE
jgi:hypothetical protein